MEGFFAPRRRGVMVLVGLLSLAATAATAATVQAEGAQGAAGADSVLVDLRVWQDVRDPLDVWTSARPAGGDWRELGTFPFPFAEDGTGRFWPITDHYRAGELAVAGVELTIAQSSHAEPHLIYVSTCRYPPSCGLILVPLDDGHSPGGHYRYGEITIAVPPPGSGPPETVAGLREVTLSEDPAFDVRVVGVRFYQGGFEFQPRNTRVYSSVFNRQTTQYIRWEVSLAYSPAPKQINFEIEAIFSGPHGEVRRHSGTFNIHKNRTNSTHSRGRGREEPPFPWPAGSYRVDLRVEGEVIASGEFQLVDSPLPGTAAFAQLRESLPWASPPRSLGRSASIHALAGLHRADQVLAASVASWPWVQQEPGDLHRRTLQQLEILAREDLQLARDAATRTWLADALTEDEWLTVRVLTLLAAHDVPLAQLVAKFEWVQDGVTARERRTLERLLTIATSGGERIGRMSFLAGLSAADTLAIEALRDLARGDQLGFGRVLSHPAIRDGISDDEAKVVAILAPVVKYAPTGLDALLHPDTVTLEERLVDLPSGVTVPVTLVRTESGATRTMDLAESALRFLEDYMGSALPAGHVIVHIGGSTSPGAFAIHFGTHIVLPATIEGEAYAPAQALKTLSHEFAHYYWTGHEDWLDEGVANILSVLTLNKHFDRKVFPEEGPCHITDHIAAWEALNATGAYKASECEYSLGERLFHELHRSLGPRPFQEGLRTLYGAVSSGMPSEACTASAAVTCEIHAAFRQSGTAEDSATVDAIIGRWYSGEGAYDLSHLDGSLPDPAVSSGEATITSAYISIAGERAEHSPVQVFSAGEVPGDVYLVLEFSLDRSNDPKEIPLVVEEAFEDGFLYRSLQRTSVFQPEWTTGWSRIAVGPPIVGDHWARGQYFVYVYQDGRKVAEVTYEVTQ